MKVRVGDHVALKGFGLVGYKGVIRRKSFVWGLRVELDPGQKRLGHSILTVRKMNVAQVLSKEYHN